MFYAYKENASCAESETEIVIDLLFFTDRAAVKIMTLSETLSSGQ